MRERVRNGFFYNNLLSPQVELTGRQASEDYDLVYGMLGLCNSQARILPRYDRPVGEVYTEVSRDYLRTPATCECYTYWTFVYAPLKHRYTSLPSWAVDWTAFEVETLLPNDMYALVQKELRHPATLTAAATRQRFPGYKFRGNVMILRGRFLDIIDTVGNAVMNDVAEDYWTDHTMHAVHTWRALVLARYRPWELYVLPSDYSGTHYDWSLAWLRMLCAGRRVDGRVDSTTVPKLTMREMRTLLEDATHDPSNLLILQHTPRYTTKPFTPNVMQQRYAQMREPELYNQVELAMS